MAYPTVSKPYGLKPINLIGGQVYAGATRQYQIASGDSTSIFYGDIVKLTTDGVVTKDTMTTAASGSTIGVFMGCSYVNAQGQTIFAQYFPANTTAPTGTVITAYVVDDPDVCFKVAYVSSGTTVAFVGRAVIGSNMTLVQNAGVAATGDSQVAVTTSATTSTLPIRVVDVVPDTANSSGDFCELVVKFNFAIHLNQIATGV